MNRSLKIRADKTTADNALPLIRIRGHNQPPFAPSLRSSDPMARLAKNP